MTLQTTTPVDDYLEDGLTLAHPIPFQFQAAADIVCSRILAGVETTLTLGTDYTISGGAGLTGTVTKMSAGVVGTTFRVKRKTTRAQTMDYTTGDAFPAESHEAALDRQAAVNQEQDVQIADVATRAIQVPFGETASLLPAAAARANKYFSFDALGKPMASAGLVGLLADANYGDFAVSGGGTIATIGDGRVSLNKLTNLAANSIIGNNGGSPATPLALTAAQVAVMLPAFTGDGGAGGVKGLVPAPGVGDGTKYLKGDGTWGTPAGGGGGAGTTSSALTFNNSGSGAASGSTFDGSIARTISFNTIGAAPLASPNLTGTPTAPTPSPGDNSTKLATTAFVAAAIAALLNAAPGALDTLKELADAIGDDANFASTMTTALAGKAPVRPTVSSASASFSAADADNNTHKDLSGVGQTLTLPNITAGTSFTARFSTAWSIACAGGLSKNGADPSAITTGSIAANSLITFLHEGAGVWIASGGGLT